MSCLLLKKYLSDCEKYGWQPSLVGARAYRDTYELRLKWQKRS